MTEKLPIVVRFWRKVNRTNNCWLWMGHRTKRGDRAQFEICRGYMVFVHRFAYELLVGPIPAGLYVCHHCDNPICVNPDHLFVGTQDDNMKDMVAKGRANKPEGERNGGAKLTEDDVRYIRKNYVRKSKTHDQQRLAEMFGVCVMTIQEILHYRKWTHVV